MEVSSHALALRPGRRGPVRRRRLHQLRPRTTSTSTPTSDDYFAAKARLFDGRCRRRGAQPRRPGADAAVQAGDGHLLGGRRRGARPGGPPTSRPTAFGQRFTAHGPDGVGRRRRGARCPAGTTWPTRCSPSPAWSRSGSTRRPPRPGVAACAGRARPAGAGRRAGPGARRGRLRAQAGRDRGRPGRAARAAPAAAAG